LTSKRVDEFVAFLDIIFKNIYNKKIKMKLIGLLSDTHGYWDDRYAKHFSGCDEIWHAGDFGSIEIADRLSDIAFLRGVYGNIDGHDVRMRFSERYRFRCEDVDVLMKHIGGYPGHYD
jgi:predicted phosphodiesterase